MIIIFIFVKSIDIPKIYCIFDNPSGETTTITVYQEYSTKDLFTLSKMTDFENNIVCTSVVKGAFDKIKLDIEIGDNIKLMNIYQMLSSNDKNASELGIITLIEELLNYQLCKEKKNNSQLLMK